MRYNPSATSWSEGDAVDPISLVAGRDYPYLPRFRRNVPRMKPLCETYLANLRWPQGFVCLNCKSNVVPRQSTRGRLVCPRCRHPATVSAGTTRTPLTTWFQAAWHVSIAKNGMSAKTLERMRTSISRSLWCPVAINHLLATQRP